MWVPDIADETRMRDVLTKHAGVLGIDPAAPCRLVDARVTHSHRPSSSRCRGRATYSAGSALLYLKAFPDGASEGAWSALGARGVDTAAVHLRDNDLIVWRFPHDPALPALPDLVDPAHLASHLPVGVGAASTGDVDVAVVRYQPETSCTVRCQIGAATVFAKMLAGVDVGPIATRHERLWQHAATTPALRIAEPLGADVDRGVLWTRGVVGPSLGEGLRADRLASVAEGVAATLAALHGSPVDGMPTLTVDECVVEAAKKASKLSEACSAVSPRVDAVMADIERFGDGSPSSRVRSVHGDCHSDQFLDADHGPVLVDLDSMVAGPPELDLAEFVVDLVVRDLPESVARDLTAVLLPAYEQAEGAASVDVPLLRVLAAAEFLTRCHRHLRRRSPGWETDLERALGSYDALDAALPS